MPEGYQSYLYSTFVQTLLYGIYVATLAHCLRWLLLDDEGWKLRQKINWPMLFISILLFLLSTADLALTFKSLIDFNNLQASSTNLYSDIFSALEEATLLIVDSVLIYRLWMVYQKSWRVICPPIVLWLGCVTCAILLNFYRRFALRRQLDIITTFYSCNIAINLYATSLIVHRIMRVAHDGKAIGRTGQLYRATRIIAESGILYTLTSILHLVVQLTRVLTPAEVGEAINFSTAGIAFNLILIRVGQNRNDVDERNRLDTQWVKKELSALQFNSPLATSQDRSLAVVEEGVKP